MALFGSGKYVGITAGDTHEHSIGGGIFFGTDSSDPTCLVQAKYQVNIYSEIVGACLDMSGRYNESTDKYSQLYLEFPNLVQLSINNFTGYTGSINVRTHAVPVDINTSYFAAKTYNFKCGLLLNSF